MKRLVDHMDQESLRKMEVITATALNQHLGECLTLTQMGKTYCIKRKGKIMGFLIPPGGADVPHEIQPDGTCETLDPEWLAAVAAVRS